MKKLVAIAALLSLALPAVPTWAAATVTTGNGPVIVKWNTQAVANLFISTDYSATGAFGATAGSILTNANSGSGSCTAADPTNADFTVDFGNVSPDSSAAYTDCMYKNAVNAAVTTSSINWNLAAKVTSGSIPADTALCALPNGGGGSFPFTAAALPVTQTARAAAPSIVSVAACPAGDALISTTSVTLANETNPFSSASTANIGHDLELVLKPLAGAGAQTATITYTLTAN